MARQVIVMVGNISEGWQMIGPFPSWDDASSWADEHGFSTIDSWIATLDDPTEVGRTCKVYGGRASGGEGQ